jgi:amphi-Trp domain-containing protein
MHDRSIRSGQPEALAEAERLGQPAQGVAEKHYPPKQFVAKLRRLADCIEQGKHFQIQVAGERISIPPDVSINIEHERGSRDEELEFQLKWSSDRVSAGTQSGTTE